MIVTLVHNPKAGAGGASADHLIDLLREAGHQVRYVSKKDDTLPEVLRGPADLIAVAGGDGTVAEVAAHLPPRDAAPLALLPLGTANNIATALGIEGRPEEIVRAWPSASRRSFDLWQAKGPWGTRLILEGCGFGALARTAHEMTSRDTSDMSGEQKLTEARRVLSELARREPPVSLQADLDGESIEGDFLLFEALNIGRVGPRVELVPDADSSDERLDVAFVAYGPDAATAIPVATRRCSRVDLTCRGGRVRLDDEFWPDKDAPESESTWGVTITRANRTLTVLVPSDGRQA